MGRKRKYFTKEEINERNKLKSKRYYQRNRKQICEKRMRKYWKIYDEPHHYNIYGQLKEKDIKRMIEIKNHLHCRFYRYNEKTKELKEHL